MAGTIESTTGGVKFPDGSTQIAGVDSGEIIGGFNCGSGGCYLPVCPTILTIVASNYTVAQLKSSGISGTINGASISNTNNARVIHNTWNTSVANQVTFYFGFWDTNYTKVAQVKLYDNGGVISGCQLAAYAWGPSSNTLSSSAWTTTGGIPASSLGNTAGSGGYGVNGLTITY